MQRSTARLIVAFLTLNCLAHGRLIRSAAAESLRIVERGQPRAGVVIPADARAGLKASAQLLVRYVQRASGAELPIIAESPVAVPQPPAAGKGPNGPPLAIYLGPCRYSQSQNLGLEQLDGDGFLIRVVDAGHLIIAGPTDDGTEFGVGEFLERFVGVRWLMPGDHGDDVPRQATTDVSMDIGPAGEIRQQPAFFSRLFSGLSGEAQTTWARRNRMHGRVQFHHNLLNLFPPETYIKTHPEFFPIRNGARFLPPTNHTHGWQPCFSAPGLADEAARNIQRYFAAHPEVTSYSLGANDSSGYCQCPDCLGQEPAAKNFLGVRHSSDAYFAWCNAVVERVLPHYPDKWFGCLAYSEVAQPPDRVAINARIIPFMTYDRMKWVDPDLRTEGQEMTRHWHKASSVLGWYDYVYGSPYLLPRIWFHQMAGDYRFAQATGVKAVYAEAYPNWGEGPKLYVMLKLLWNPQADVDALLRDWYVRAVGPDAADDLAKYYERWEFFWTGRILKSKWFTKRGQYLAFYNPSYLDDVTSDDMDQSSTLLDRVVARAGTADQKARARLLQRAFYYYMASAEAYSARRLAERAPATEAEAIQTLDLAKVSLRMARWRLDLALKEFPQDPVLRLPIDFTQAPLLRGDSWGSEALWPVFDWAARSDGPVRQKLRTLAADSDQPGCLQARTMLCLIDHKSPPVSRNPAFTAGKGTWPKDWSRWVRDRGSITLDARAGIDRQPGILCKGVTRGGPFQDLDLPAGRYGAVARIRVPRAVEGHGTLALTVVGINDKRQNFGLPLTSTIVACPGGWTRLAVAGDIPERAKNDRLKQIRMILIVDGFQGNDEVYVSELALYRLE